MNRLVNALILFIGFGLKVQSLHDRAMVYGFDNVSPGVYGITSLKDFKLLTSPLDSTVGQPHMDSMFRCL